MPYFQTEPEVDPYRVHVEKLEDAVRHLRRAFDTGDAPALEHWARVCASLGRNLAADVGLLGRNGFPPGRARAEQEPDE